MVDDPTLDDIPEDERARFLAFRAKVDGANINPQTLLATDYLNHFNEIVMMIEMLPDAPDCIEDVNAWQPKTYAEHFRDSGFKDKDLAIEAYGAVPTKFREPFEKVVEQMNRIVRLTATRFTDALAAGEEAESQRDSVAQSVDLLHRLGEIASSIIHGSTKTLDQDEIDGIVGR